MPGLLPDVDPDGLYEFSVVYTDRALNHMSKRFQGVMTDISAMLKRVYGAHSAVLVPGSGTFGMESVARQFAHGQHVMVIRNGWFSYRWTQIFDMGSIPASHTVMKARRIAEGSQAAWAPAPIAEVTAAIAAEKPALVFAPHVETAAGMILPEDLGQQLGPQPPPQLGVLVHLAVDVVQHLEGGIVQQILVREGQVVQAGDVLMRLSDVQANTSVQQGRSRLHALLAQQARLTAEAQGLVAPQFSSDVPQDIQQEALNAFKERLSRSRSERLVISQ